MRKRAKRYIFGPFTDRELTVIQLRTNGVKGSEIASRLGVPRNTVYGWIMSVYKKAGVDDVATLTRWAMANGLDEPAAPDGPETALVPEPKVRRNLPIKLGRIRRSKIFGDVSRVKHTI